MRKSRFTETQIVKILKEVEAGRSVKDVCREYGVSDATYYNWKSKYGGMESADIKRLKELEEENRRLKQMYADLSLEHRILKDVVEKSFNAVGEARTGRCRRHRVWRQCSAGMPHVVAESLSLRLPARSYA